MNQFVHNADMPMIFFFDSIGGIEPEVIEWLGERKPPHVFRALVNAERAIYGHLYEITFLEPRDAIEFKLKFL